MNADLPTDDLKRKRASRESFGPVGQPGEEIERVADGGHEGKLRVAAPSRCRSKLTNTGAGQSRWSATGASKA